MSVASEQVCMWGEGLGSEGGTVTHLPPQWGTEEGPAGAGPGTGPFLQESCPDLSSCYFRLLTSVSSLLWLLTLEISLKPHTSV